MTLTKRILSGLLAAGMILSLTACDEEPAVSGGNSAGNTPGASAVTTTAATTTTDPDDNAPTDAEIKEVGTDAYTPDGNSGTIVWLGMISSPTAALPSSTRYSTANFTAAILSMYQQPAARLTLRSWLL